MLESYAVGFAICDLSGAVLAADAAFLDLVGRKPGDLAGLNRSAFLHPEDKPRDVISLHRFASDARPVELRERYVGAAGAPVHVQTRMSRIQSNGGPAVMVVSRPLAQDGAFGRAPPASGLLSLAGYLGETAAALGAIAQDAGLVRTAGLLEQATDEALPEARARARA